MSEPALDYVIDGDREYRKLEAELNAANERNDGHAIATVHGKLDAIDALDHSLPRLQPAARPRVSATNSLNAR